MKQRINLSIDEDILKEFRENFPHIKLSHYLESCMKIDLTLLDVDK